MKLHTPAIIPSGTKSLLLHMDTSGFTDSGGNNVALLSNQGVTQDTVNKKFGVSAASFDGETEVLRYQNSSLFTLDTGPFIIDMWMRITGDAGLSADNARNAALITAGFLKTDNSSHWRLYVSGSSTTTGTGLFLAAFNASSTLTRAAINYNFSKNTWYHLAVSRTSAGVIRFHVNGVLINKISDTIGTGTALLNRVQYPVRIGNLDFGAGYPLNFVGQLDEVRVVKGSWLPESFTPPAAPYI